MSLPSSMADFVPCDRLLQKAYRRRLRKERKGKEIACVASVSVEFGSKERPRNGVFGILPARKMGREPKKERWG